MMYNNKMVCVVKTGNKILRENNGEVLMPFGSEYSISLKNLHNRKALVSISVDGDDVLDGSQIIVEPNTTTTLEGFMKGNEVSNKFKFIEKTDEISDFRGDQMEDGLITITFRFESPLNDSVTWYSGGFDNSGLNYPKGVRSWPSVYGSTINSCADTSQVPMASCNFTASVPETENGITVKGSQSDQSFRTGSVGIMEGTTHTMILHLKGLTTSNSVVSEPIFVKTKIQCETCGRKWKSSNQFCGGCGTSLV